MSGSEKTFLVIGVLGFALLLLSFLFGELFEFGGDALDVEVDGSIDATGDSPGVSWLSTKVLFASMVGFGAFGFIAAQYKLPFSLDWIAALCGFFLIGAGAFFLVLKPLAEQQSNSLVSRQSYIGRTGLVSLSIPEQGFGEIKFRDRENALVAQRAVTADGQSLPDKTPVIIIDVAKDGVVVSPNPIELQE